MSANAIRPICFYLVWFSLEWVVVSCETALSSPPNDRDRQVQLDELDPVSKLQWDQVGQLIEGSEIQEALESLQKIVDKNAGALIAFPELPLNQSFGVYRFLPVEPLAALRKTDWSRTNASIHEQLQTSVAPAIEGRWERLHYSSRLDELEQLALDAAGCDLAAKVWQLAGDSALQRGWIARARRCYYEIDHRLRAPIQLDASPVRSSIPWHFLIGQVRQDQPFPEHLRARFLSPSQNTKALTPGNAAEWQQLAAVWARLTWCSILDGDLDRANQELRMYREVFESKRHAPGVDKGVDKGVDEVNWGEKLRKLMAEPRSEALEGKWMGNDLFQGSTFGTCAARHSVPNWSINQLDQIVFEHPLPRRLGESDQSFVGGPRVAENQDGLLSYHCLLHQQRAFVHDLKHIWAFDLPSGKVWPPASPSVPLLDHSTPENVLVPLGYPLLGVPRSTLSAKQNCLYSRVGSTVTAWRDRDDNSRGSLSSIVGLDLDSEGKMLPGFPIRLLGEEWNNYEFEGTPLAIDDDLFAVVTQRNSVHLRRYIVSFNRYRGTLQWKSPLISAALPSSFEQANLISHQLLSYSDGRLFFQTGLGSIAAVEAISGKIAWLVQYPRVDDRQEAYPKSMRFVHRDLTPPLVHHDLIVCAPQDCREIFALDWATGDLVWATEPEKAADAIHLLGVAGKSLIVSGDHLYWLNVDTGRMLARFPEAGTDLPGHASPEPRGLGRGLLTNKEVYWPITKEILVFDTQLSIDPMRRKQPKLNRKMPLGVRGIAGVNMACDGKYLSLTSPTRLTVYRLSP